VSGQWIQVWSYLGWNQYGYKGVWCCDRCGGREWSPRDHSQEKCDRLEQENRYRW